MKHAFLISLALMLSACGDHYDMAKCDAAFKERLSYGATPETEAARKKYCPPPSESDRKFKERLSGLDK
jgi:hypothetical protein